MKPASDIIDFHPPAVATSGAARPSRLVDFYELTKPRMNFLVVITTMVGFLLAQSSGATNWTLLFHVLLGTALCAAGAAIINQLIERDRDALMPRTRNRPIVAGRIAPAEAMIFGGACGFAGIAYLYVLVNPLTALLGFATVALYLLVYTPAKRFTTLNTVIGAVPGAIPPVMGFTAIDNALSPGAIALFLILFFWQMPHFLAIAILYRDDYRAGGFKMLPSVEVDPKLPITGRMMVLYAIALIPVSLLPVQLSVAGPAYFTAALLLGLAFLSFTISCATSGGSRVDARKLFFASIIYLPLLLAAMLLDKTWFMRSVVAQLLLAVMLVGCDQRASATATVDASTIRGNGIVRGQITLDGPPPVMSEIRNQPCCDAAPKTLTEETVVVGTTGGLANAFVYIEGLPRVNGRSLASPQLDQVGCRYTPHVVGVCIGQPLRIRTSDATMHNVHFSPDRNESRNFGMVSPGDEKTVTFREPEFIRMKCDVHPWMTAYIGVFENPCFAVTDSDGRFELANLPAGKYKLVTWHERYGRLEQPVEITEMAPTLIDLKYAAPANNQ